MVKWGLTASLTGASLLLLDALFFEKYFFEVKQFEIGEKEGQKKLRLLLLTDLHIKRVLWPYYDRLASRINSLQPDLIMIAGDTLDGHSDIVTVDKFFGKLEHGLKKVAILGNHDHFDRLPISALRTVYERHNVDLLVNETKVYNLQGERFVVTGLDDFIESNSCFLEAVAEVGREEHHVLLIHSPLQQESIIGRMKELNEERESDKQINISYIFAGHNHGGQVRFLNVIPKLPIMSGPYVEGWYNREKPYLYLSKGFGTSTVPFRFGARAEIALFHYQV